MEIQEVAVIARDSSRNLADMTQRAADQQLRQEATARQMNEMLLRLQNLGEIQRQAFLRPQNLNFESTPANMSLVSIDEIVAAPASHLTKQGKHPFHGYGVRVRATPYRRVECTNGCHCACHKISKARSPNFLHSVIGSLFIGYSVPILNSCDVPSCQRRAKPMVKVNYHFPLWLLARSISVGGLFPNVGPERLLGIYRTIPLGSLSLRLAIKGDLPGLARMMHEGAAHANDANTNNYSLLEVSENFAARLQQPLLKSQRRQSTTDI